MDLSLLTSPLAVGSAEIRNRVVFTAHGAFLSYYRPGESGEQYTSYLERRAAGGAGLVIMQPVQAHSSSRAPGHYTPEPRDLLPKLRQTATRLHARGAVVLLQLMHFGAEFRSDDALHPLWSFSGAVSPSGSEASHAMSDAELESVAEGFVEMARLAVEAGLDGVELHAAHGYLLHQSLSPWGNRRTDRWGRPLAFVETIVDAIRAAVGREPLLGVRISAEDYRRPAEGGQGPQGLAEIARALAGSGQLDYLNHSAGSRSAHYARAVADYRHPEHNLLDLTIGLHRALDGALPLIGVGRIATPQVAEQVLRQGACELVAMTRAQIADPDLIAKAVAGRHERIRPCVGANAGCVDRMVGGRAITCFHNPEVGREHLGPPAPAQPPKRVLVLGGGPAGLAAAIAAAARGHRVSLVERERELGGRLRLLQGPARTLLETIRWREGELERLGVEVLLGTQAQAADTRRDQAPDVVLLATGARPQVEPLPRGDGSVPVLSVEQALRDELPGPRVLLVDHLGVEEGPMCAEALASKGAEVTILTPLPSVGAHIGFTRISSQLRRLYEAGCALEPSTVLTGVRDGAATTRQIYSGRQVLRRFDAVVAVVHGSPELELGRAWERLGVPVSIAGDARAPRTALHAFREGDEIGRAA
jgi:2,4-dienoyl-CoA reductase-like NADH-dependent reductase (Old Yellow Enzyme family)